MSTPIPPSSPGERDSSINRTPLSESQSTEQISAQAQRPKAQSLTKTDSSVWKDVVLANIDSISKLKTVVSNSVNSKASLPMMVEVREFKIGNEKASLQIAENIGATPVQIKTADGTDLLWSPIASNNYNNQLKGAGSVGGIPIVGPAGRTAYGDDKKPEIHVDGQKLVEFDEDELGPDGRIAVDGNGVASHGPLFTSPHWKLTAAKMKKNGVQVTYVLPLNQKGSDPVVDKLVVQQTKLNSLLEGAIPNIATKPGEITATYTLELDAQGEPRFHSDIIIDPGEDNVMLLGAFAQHTFKASKEGDTLETRAKKEFEAPEDSPELPTGELITVQSKHDFSNPRVIHKDKATPLEVVLTDYEMHPKATLVRTDGYKVTSRAGGDYNGFLLCNKGKDNVMLEPIAGHPNAINVNSEYELYPTHTKPGHFIYELSVKKP